MPTPTISTITLPSGTTYEIADLAARAAAAGINMTKCTNAADTPIGVTWKDGSTTITGTLVASSTTAGKFYLVPASTESGKDTFAEYITVIDGSNYSWEKIGTTDIDLSDLGDLAYKDSASGTYTPSGSVSTTFTGSSMNSSGNFTPSGTIQVNAPSGSGTSYTPSGTIQVNAASDSGTSYTPEGSVSQPTFTGSSMTSTGKFTPGGTIQVNNSSGTGTSFTPEGAISINSTTGTSYTPEGSVSNPIISVLSPGSTAGITPFGTAGTLPSLSMTVTDGNLTIGFNQGTLPTAGTAVTVKTGDASYSASAPSFTGTAKKFSFTGVQKKFNFSGSQGTVSVSGTPSGTVSQPTFDGVEKKLAFSGDAKKLAFSGTQGSVNVSGTTTGSVTGSFTGTESTVTVS